MKWQDKIFKGEVYAKRVLFVDPGLLGTGGVYFPIIQRGKPHYPDKGFLLKAESQGEVEDRIIQLGIDFYDTIIKYSPFTVVIESQQFWRDSLTSVTSASRGDIFKTTMLVGNLLAQCSRLNIRVESFSKFHKTNIILVPPNEWKGQLPKDVVERRLRDEFEVLDDYLVDHVCDAAGMGIFCQL